MAKKKKPFDLCVMFEENGLQWFPAYPFSHVVVVYRFDDVKTIKKVFKHLTLSKKGQEPAGRATDYVMHGYKIVLIGLKDGDIRTIAHECIHARSYIFQDSNVHVDYDNDEAEAYFFGFLTQNVFDCAKKLGFTY